MQEQSIFNVGTITPADVLRAVDMAGETPFYLYDAQLIITRCREIREGMCHPHGLYPRYAMKANSNKALLQLISRQGFGMDASSLNEVRRAVMAGIPVGDILLTTQEVPEGHQRNDLEHFMSQGLKYNVCSERQLALIADFACTQQLPLSIRIHPGEGGAGESLTRDTANPYACFGVHVSILKDVLQWAAAKGIVIDQIHAHIGSGGSPQQWKAGIDPLLEIFKTHLEWLPDVRTVNLGGGLKEARMPGEEKADVAALGAYASQQLNEFSRNNGRKLSLEVEPGTYLLAMAGSLVTKVIDIKSTGPQGYNFIVADGGMEVNSRPLYYGARHPFVVIANSGQLLSMEGKLDGVAETSLWIPVGRCCETGDSQSLDAAGNIVPRKMAEPSVGDYFVIGGCGAYCSSMSPSHYNSHTRAPEVLKMPGGELAVIRVPQQLPELFKDERDLPSLDGR